MNDRVQASGFEDYDCHACLAAGGRYCLEDEDFTYGSCCQPEDQSAVCLQ